jgi:O-6-methylguanine DNA methyltransferase
MARTRLLQSKRPKYRSVRNQVSPSHPQDGFNERCYAALKKVPAGKLTTYAALAAYLGSRAYRAVGNAMHRNPNAPVVPCHRVVRSDGSIGGYAGGPDKKERMLKQEGIPVRNGRVCNLEKYLFRFR